MPKFIVTTKIDGREVRSEPIDFPSEQAATEDAQIALGEMTRDLMPDGSTALLTTEVENEAGELIYRASITFEVDVSGRSEAGRAGDDIADRPPGASQE
jgi:hypothetical protein